MPDHGSLIMTGASGTVGTALLAALSGCWTGPVIALGREKPSAAVDVFIATDLCDAASVDAAGRRLNAETHPIAGIVLAAGVDSRVAAADVTLPVADACLRVNCTAQLSLLAAAIRNARTEDMRIAVVSTDVIGKSQPATLLYAASKAALDEGVRHAIADNDRGPLTALLVRLPFIGIPMGSQNPHQPPRAPYPVLDTAISAIADFLTGPRPRKAVRVWSHA